MVIRTGVKNNYLSKGQVKSGSSLKRMITRDFSLVDGSIVQAELVIIDAKDIAETTTVHPLNPRNQAALTLESVRDILPSIRDSGVSNNGLAIRNSKTGKLELLDSSRRRFCCIHSNRNLPLWVLPELSDKDINHLIAIAAKQKKLSYREQGKKLAQLAVENNLEQDIEALAKLDGRSVESIRKRLRAYEISEDIMMLFPDYEGIPNSYYKELAKVQRALSRGMITSVQLIDKIQSEKSNRYDFVEQEQNHTLELLICAVKQLSGEQEKKAWITEDIAVFDDKKKYARFSKSPDGRSVKVELSRHSPKQYKALQAYLLKHFS